MSEPTFYDLLDEWGWAKGQKSAAGGGVRGAMSKPTFYDFLDEWEWAKVCSNTPTAKGVGG